MKRSYGVFEGGGVCGTALVGAVKAVEEAGIEFEAVAGTSAGAIIAALVAAGYTAAELQLLMAGVDYKTFKDPVSRWPGWRRLKSWRSLGLYQGEVFHKWISEKLSFKLFSQRNRRVNFEDLRLPLTVVATDVVYQQMRVYSRRFTPQFNVADAVRMSMSIPFFFCPVRSASEVLVDGGALSNFPAWAFEEDRKTLPLPILGLRLQPENQPAVQISTPIDLARSLISTMIKTAVQMQVAHVADLFVIDLPILDVRVTDFDISDSRKDELFEAGYRTAKAYLATTKIFPGSEPNGVKGNGDGL